MASEFGELIINSVKSITSLAGNALEFMPLWLAEYEFSPLKNLLSFIDFALASLLFANALRLLLDKEKRSLILVMEALIQLGGALVLIGSEYLGLFLAPIVSLFILMMKFVKESLMLDELVKANQFATKAIDDALFSAVSFLVHQQLDKNNTLTLDRQIETHQHQALKDIDTDKLPLVKILSQKVLAEIKYQKKNQSLDNFIGQTLKDYPTSLKQEMVKQSFALVMDIIAMSLCAFIIVPVSLPISLSVTALAVVVTVAELSWVWADKDKKAPIKAAFGLDKMRYQDKNPAVFFGHPKETKQENTKLNSKIVKVV